MASDVTIVNFRLPVAERDLLHELAWRKRTTASELIRAAIRPVLVEAERMVERPQTAA